ncbi:MAG TPA: hypothetical protein VF165_07455 [Nocardioidaceae bacterium]
MRNRGNGGRSHLAGLVLGLTAALTLLLVAFAWPPSELRPRDLPVAVAGPPGAAQQVSAAVDDALGSGALDVRAVPSRTAAVAAIENRDVYGAVVVSPSGPEMLVASAGSPVVAQSLTLLGAQLAARNGTTPRVADVVPLPAADPHGAVFAAGAFPLVIGGIAVGAALALALDRRRTKVATVLGLSVAAGLSLAAVQQFWFDALGGSYWANSGVYALAIGAMAAIVTGLHQALGRVGLALAAATILLLGNPLSGITSAPELLPSGWSLLGQLLPPGAAGTALRSTAFFDGAGAATSLLVLAGWLAVGLALLAWPARSSVPSAQGHPARRTGSREGKAVDAPHAA